MRLHLDSTASRPVESGQVTSAPVSGDAGSFHASGVPGSKDSAAISGPASALNRLSSERAARVQQLSAAVRNGSFRVSSAAVSSAIVGHAIS